MNKNPPEQIKNVTTVTGYRQVALWKRDNREALKLWVKGMIMLEPDDAKRAAAEEFAEYGAKFWGYPVLVAADEAAGRVLAQTLLLK